MFSEVTRHLCLPGISGSHREGRIVGVSSCVPLIMLLFALAGKGLGGRKDPVKNMRRGHVRVVDEMLECQRHEGLGLEKLMRIEGIEGKE